jgi:hypothetical protein
MATTRLLQKKIKCEVATGSRTKELLVLITPTGIIYQWSMQDLLFSAFDFEEPAASIFKTGLFLPAFRHTIKTCPVEGGLVPNLNALSAETTASQRPFLELRHTLNNFSISIFLIKFSL